MRAKKPRCRLFCCQQSSAHKKKPKHFERSNFTDFALLQTPRKFWWSGIFGIGVVQGTCAKWCRSNRIYNWIRCRPNLSLQQNHRRRQGLVFQGRCGPPVPNQPAVVARPQKCPSTIRCGACAYLVEYIDIQFNKNLKGARRTCGAIAKGHA